MKMPISNDTNSGTTRRQALYDEPESAWAWFECSDYEFWPEDPTVRELEERWQVWLTAKKQIEESDRATMLAEVQRAAKEIDRDNQNELFEELEAKAIADREKSERETREYIDAMVAAFDRAWRRQALAKLQRSAAVIAKDIVKRERKAFGIGRHRV